MKNNIEVLKDKLIENIGKINDYDALEILVYVTQLRVAEESE